MCQQQGGHIGLRAGGNDGDRLLAFPQHLGHQLHRAERGKLSRRLRQLGAVQSRLPVDVPGGDGIGKQGAGATHGDGGIDAQKGGDTAGIVGGFFDGLIAGDRGDPADIQKRAGLGQHPCDGVIVAGVAIQQNRQLLKVVHR